MIKHDREFPTIDTDLFPFHHRALTSGYVPKEPGTTGFFAYKGNHGLGYVRYVTNPASTRYCYVEYYIYKPPKTNA